MVGVVSLGAFMPASESTDIGLSSDMAAECARRVLEFDVRKEENEMGENQGSASRGGGFDEGGGISM
jgi:hypothetical protein